MPTITEPTLKRKPKGKSMQCSREAEKTAAVFLGIDLLQVGIRKQINSTKTPESPIVGCGANFPLYKFGAT